MPGGLICEMGTFCVIYFFFFRCQKILARTKRLHFYHTNLWSTCRLPRISFSITLLGCSLHLIYSIVMELALEQSAIRTILAELGNNTGFCEQKSPKCRLSPPKVTLNLENWERTLLKKINLILRQRYCNYIWDKIPIYWWQKTLGCSSCQCDCK